MDSRQFVVFSDRPSTPYSPRRCSVRVSSSPSFRLPAADWFLQLATQRLCLAGHHTAGVNQLELVDGQQRLTTIGILLHCLLDRLKSESQVDDARDLARLLNARALGGESQPKILLDLPGCQAVRPARQRRSDRAG